MGVVGILKPGLFIYECVRIIILAFVLVIIMPEKSSIPWLAFIAPGALFPLMALFLWLDILYYKAFIPLFIAGKCIGIFSLLIWSLISRQLTMIEGFAGYLIIPEMIFLCGDLFALAAILFIYRSMQIVNKPLAATAETPDTEDA
uniref:Uncharacterized protein n=1 Tax=uncultured bacterium contig00053 TaxID=1181537 RepID=A0A806JY66_9BACT|nr:hypothetical protein [uncultured bacterium contig00053]